MKNTTDFMLSRRRLLASLGAVGLASAGTGPDTSAYFSDEETCKDTSLVAAARYVKDDREDHHSDWSAGETTFGLGSYTGQARHEDGSGMVPVRPDGSSGIGTPSKGGRTGRTLGSTGNGLRGTATVSPASRVVDAPYLCPLPVITE